MKVWTVEDFRPLAEATEEQMSARRDYLDKSCEARTFLNRVKKRQQQDAAALAAMLQELKSEEDALRQQVREDANRRAKARLTGQQPPETNNSAGARLAAIPDERTAIEALHGVKEMTPEECEEWEKLYSDLADAADRSNRANGSVLSMLNSWAVLIKEATQLIGTSEGRADASAYASDAYALNSNPSGGEWAVAYGRKVE